MGPVVRFLGACALVAGVACSRADTRDDNLGDTYASGESPSTPNDDMAGTPTGQGSNTGSSSGSTGGTNAGATDSEGLGASDAGAGFEPGSPTDPTDPADPGAMQPGGGGFPDLGGLFGDVDASTGASQGTGGFGDLGGLFGDAGTGGFPFP